MSTFSREKFAQRLHNLRIERHITQRDLAKALGVTDMTISRYEAGSVEPSIDIIYRICDYFDVGLSYILGETEYNPKDRPYFQNLDLFSGALLPTETASEAFVQILNISPVLKDHELRTIRDYFSFLLSQRENAQQDNSNTKDTL